MKDSVSTRPRYRTRLAQYAGFFPPGVMFAKVPSRHGAVALTFDDGPHPEYTDRILDTLGRHQAHATFFAVGKCARAHPRIVRRIVDEGHTLGCHTDTHADLARIGPIATWRECVQAQHTLQELSARPVRYLRPPWGHIGTSGLPIAVANRMAVAMWSLDSLDYQKLAAEELVTHMRQAAPEPGDVILFHDDGANTVQALPDLLALFRERGLSCLSLEEISGATAIVVPSPPELKA